MATEQAYWNEMYAAACEQRRPFVQLRPSMSVDGDQWCALYGDDIQRGVAGFGKSPELAAWDFDKAWIAHLSPSAVNTSSVSQSEIDSLKKRLESYREIIHTYEKRLETNEAAEECRSVGKGEQHG